MLRGRCAGRCQVTLIDRRNHHLFQPLLYQVAMAALSPGDIASPIRWILRRQRNVEVLLAEATAIDTATRTVVLTDGEIGYDYLIVATGSTHAYFGHDEWQPDAPALKTLEDALEIRRRVLLAFERAEKETVLKRRRRLLNFVVVGGGPTGVELAGAIAEIRGTLYRRTSAISIPVQRASCWSRPDRRCSVITPNLCAMRPGTISNGLASRCGRDPALPTSTIIRSRVGTEVIDAETILWAAGVAASPLGATLDVPRDRVGRVLVNRT